jgi:hypothetical protein
MVLTRATLPPAGPPSQRSGPRIFAQFQAKVRSWPQTETNDPIARKRRPKTLKQVEKFSRICCNYQTSVGLNSRIQPGER